MIAAALAGCQRKNPRGGRVGAALTSMAGAVLALRVMMLRLGWIAWIGMLATGWAGQRSIEVGPNPESVVRGFGGALYVTLMGATREPGDGNGKVVVLDGDTPRDFATGLDDPKGLAFLDNRLITADFNKVWSIDAKGVKTLLAGPGAFPQPPVFLNDVAIAPDGKSVLVTDMGARDKLNSPDGAFWPLDSPEARAVPNIGRVYQISLDGKVTELIPAGAPMTCPNGIDVLPDGRVRIAEFFTGAVLEWRDGKWSELVRGHRSGDGLGHDGKGNLYVSEVRTGMVWRYAPGWQQREALGSGLASAADLLVDAANRQLVVPDTRAGKLFFIPIAP